LPSKESEGKRSRAAGLLGGFGCADLDERALVIGAGAIGLLERVLEGDGGRRGVGDPVGKRELLACRKANGEGQVQLLLFELVLEQHQPLLLGLELDLGAEHFDDRNYARLLAIDGAAVKGLGGVELGMNGSRQPLAYVAGRVP